MNLPEIRARDLRHRDGRSLIKDHYQIAQDRRALLHLLDEAMGLLALVLGHTDCSTCEPQIRAFLTQHATTHNHGIKS